MFGCSVRSRPLLLGRLAKVSKRPRASSVSLLRSCSSLQTQDLSAQSAKQLPNLNLTSFASCKRLEDHYTVKRQLGEGSYACVHEVEQDGTAFAAKVISKSTYESCEDDIDAEMEICASLDHPNVSKLVEVLRTESMDSYLVLILELCRGGDLFDAILEQQYFNERDAAAIMKQIFKAVYYMHEKNVVHRDLKPENFLFKASGDLHSGLTVLDFGFARRFHGEPFERTCGSPSYIAPEVLIGEGYSLQCDLWSCGVIMYILLAGFPPFAADVQDDLFESIIEGHFEFEPEYWDGISEDAKDLIRRLLNVDPASRISAKECLSHVWIRQHAPRASSVPISPRVIENLRRFQQDNIFKTHAKHAMMKVCENVSTVEKMKSAFDSMDDNGDGELSQEELITGLKMSNLPIPTDIERLIQSVTLNDRKIKYTDFLVAAVDIELWFKEQDCKKAFQTFDINKDGFISTSELTTVLNSELHGNPKHRLSKIMRAFREADADNNELIDYNEFKAMILS